MAFDPNKPTEGMITDAVEMRGQLNALKALMDEKPSMEDVNAAITNNAAYSIDGFNTLDLTISNPPTQAQVQAIVDAFNNLINRLTGQ